MLYDDDDLEKAIHYFRLVFLPAIKELRNQSVVRCCADNDGDERERGAIRAFDRVMGLPGQLKKGA